MEYLLILVMIALFTFYIDYKNNFRLYDSKIERLIIPLFFLLVGAIWDTSAVIMGHWYFNAENLVGLKLGVLPIEEYLFFLIVPYMIITLYKYLKKKI